MKLNKELKKVEMPEDMDALDVIQLIALFWGVIKVVLSIVKVFTNDESDEKIDVFVEKMEAKLPK